MRKPDSKETLFKAGSKPRRRSLSSRFKSGLLMGGRRRAAVRLGLEPSQPRR